MRVIDSPSKGREEKARPVAVWTIPVIQAEESAGVEMDKAGYFVIIPQPGKGLIVVEHYSYDHKLLRVIEGKDARNLYRILIQNGWVTQLSPAGYLGEELAKASPLTKNDPFVLVRNDP